MHPFKLLAADDHLLIEHNGQRILIDTGSPATVGDDATWNFLGEDHPLVNNYMGATTSHLSELVGTEINILLGADLLSSLYTEIDSANRTITFHQRRPEFDGTRMGLANVMGIPVTATYTEKWRINAVIDTGAKMSYVDHRIAANYPPTGEVEDFYPIIGRFTTTVHEIPFTVAEVDLTLRCGVLPDQLSTLLARFDVSAIIGTEFFAKFHVCLNLPVAEMIFRKH